MTADTKPVIARIPTTLHTAIRLKSVRTHQPLTDVIQALLEEWLNEPEPQPVPTTATKPRRTKQAQPA